VHSSGPLSLSCARHRRSITGCLCLTDAQLKRRRAERGRLLSRTVGWTGCFVNEASNQSAASTPSCSLGARRHGGDYPKRSPQTIGSPPLIGLSLTDAVRSCCPARRRLDRHGWPLHIHHRAGGSSSRHCGSRGYQRIDTVDLAFQCSCWLLNTSYLCRLVSGETTASLRRAR